MVGDQLQYERETDEPYCEECGEDITPEGLFIGRCTNCSHKTSKQHSKIQNESNIHSKKQSDNNQQKRDDEALHVSHLGTRSTEEGNNTMEYKTNVVDNHADNPQDDPGQASGADKGDTGDGTFPADLKLLKKASDLVMLEDKKLLEELSKK